jgi:hypothetical protein
MLLSAMVIARGRKEKGGWSSTRIENRQMMRRRSLENEERHTQNGEGGGAQPRSADLVDRPNPYGLR